MCKRCNLESERRTKRELICNACEEDLDLLDKQLKVNNDRIKKLEEHKKITESELKKTNSEKNSQTVLETMRRIEKNLKEEYELRKGIIDAMNSKKEF